VHDHHDQISGVCYRVFVGCWSLEEQNEQTLFEGTNHACFGSQWNFPEHTSGIMRKSMAIFGKYVAYNSCENR